MALLRPTMMLGSFKISKFPPPAVAETFKLGSTMLQLQTISEMFRVPLILMVMADHIAEKIIGYMHHAQTHNIRRKTATRMIQ